MEAGIENGPVEAGIDRRAPLRLVGDEWLGKAAAIPGFAGMPAVRRLIPEEDLVIVIGVKIPNDSVVATAPNVSVDTKRLLPLGVDATCETSREHVFRDPERGGRTSGIVGPLLD